MLLDSAVRLLDCGTALAESGQYGVARSLVILAAEEASRALFYAFYGLGARVSPEALGHTSHRRRHGFIAEQMRFRRLAFDGFVAGLDFKTRAPPSNEEIQQGWQKYRSLMDGEPEARRATIDGWWQRASDAKNAGFYVDYIGADWRTPGDISREEYGKAVEIVEEFVENAGRAVVGFLQLPAEEQTRIVTNINELAASQNGET